MGIEKGEGLQVKGIHNIFNKMTAENFPNIKKEMPIQVQDAFRTPNRHDQNKTSPWHIIVKIIRTENEERILNAITEKNQITYEGKPIRTIADFSTETLKARREWSKVF
jgi:hypothetical protein